MSQETPHQETPRPEVPPEAVPSPTVPEHAEFRIVLSGLDLSPEDEERIAREIRGAVEQQLAALGHEGRFVVAPAEGQAQTRPLLGESSRLIGIVVRESKKE
jgi:hypothetical protein